MLRHSIIITALVLLAILVGCSNPPVLQQSVYELAVEKLDYQTAQHWKGVARNINSEQAINELVFLPEEGRLVLAEDIEGYAANGNIEDKELSDLIDVDGDGELNSKDAYPMDPCNTAESISPNTFSFVRNLVGYNDSQGNVETLPQIYSGLESIIDVVESNPQLIRDFTSLQNHIFANLVSGIPEITKYPKAMRQGTIQVTSQNLADKYAMEKFVVPAIEYMVKLQDEGKISALNGLGIPDAALEAEGIRQILLPIELREVNIKTGVRTTASLETGIYNVTFDKSLGASLQEWLGEMSRKDYGDKNSVGYKRAIASSDSGLSPSWDNSYAVFLAELDNLLSSKKDIPAFIRGYPVYLRTGANIIPKLTGQTAPYYSILIGRGFGEAVFDVVAEYPRGNPKSKTFTHSEPYILLPFTDNNWILPYRFGFWLTKEDFVKDYDGKLNEPILKIRNVDGTYESIKLEQNLSQQKK